MLNKSVWIFRKSYYIKPYFMQIYYINLLNKLTYFKKVKFINSYNLLNISKRYLYQDNENIKAAFKTAKIEIDEITGNDKVVCITVNSLRIDLILKVGLGISRKKIESAFYANKIRKNGRKIFKKSDIVELGDEIDLINNKIHNNPNFLIVSRIKIVDLNFENDFYKIKITRDNNLLVENELFL